MIRRIHHRDLARGQFHEPAAADTGPDIPFPILVQTSHPVVGQPVCAAQMHGALLRVDDVQSLIGGAGGDQTVMQLQQWCDRTHPPWGGIDVHGPFSILPLAQPAIGADPQPAIATRAQPLDIPAVGGAVEIKPRQLSVLENRHPPRPGDPHHALTIPCQRELPRSVTSGGREHQSILQSGQQTFFLQQPDVSRIVGVDGKDFSTFPRNAAHVDRLEMSVPIACEVARFLPNPQRSITVLE